MARRLRCRRLRRNAGSDAVSAVEHRGAVRDLVDRIDENDALLAESLDHGPIVDDLVIDVKRSAEEFEGLFQALDRHVDAGAEPARIGEDNVHVGVLLPEKYHNAPSQV